MITTVLRKMAYEGTNIYILNYNYTFQYLFSWNNEVYRQEVRFVPGSIWRRIAWWLGDVQFPYTSLQFEQAEHIMLSGAMQSIDLLKQPGAAKRRAITETRAKKNKECTWQAQERGPGAFVFVCLTHNEEVAMVDGVPPNHNG